MLLLAFPPDGSWTVGPFGNGPASRSVELAPPTQISRGFHDARMTRLSVVRSSVIRPARRNEKAGNCAALWAGGRRRWRMRRFDISTAVAAKCRAAEDAGAGRGVEIRRVSPKSEDRRMQNQPISDLPTGRKMNCDERQARRNRAVISRRRNRTFSLSALDDRPKPAYSLGANGPRNRRIEDRMRARGGSPRMQRARRNPALLRAGIIGEFIPGGNAMVVVEFVSLIHLGKCWLCRPSPSNPMFTGDGIVAVNVM